MTNLTIEELISFTDTPQSADLVIIMEKNFITF